MAGREKQMRRVRSGLIATVLAVAGWGALAPVAQAGTVGVSAVIKGAGSVASTEGGPYSCARDNGYNQNATSTCGRLAFEAALEAWVWLRATPSNVPSGNWSFAGWSGCDMTRVTGFGVECAVHSGAFSLDERFPTATFVDVQNPSLSLGSISARVPNPLVSISFASSDPTAGFRCAIDSGAFNACSPGTFTLPEGTHTFKVFAQDPSGRVSTTASQNVTVDTIAPVATIGGGPAEGSRVNTKSASFTFSASETAGLSCSLDNPALTACGGGLNLTSLSEGSHTVRLRANDGFRDSPVVTRTWTVDTLPPTLAITGGPANGASTRGNVSFAFSSDEPATFTCQRTGAGAAGCGTGTSGSVAYNSLPEGTYTFTLTGNDGLNPSSSITRTWTVDLTPPETTIAGGPSQGQSVSAPSVEFAFTSNETGVTYECSLDGGAFATCPNPHRIAGLASGDHTLDVLAKDAAGNVDGTAARRSWRMNPLDLDGDGYNGPSPDCDDADPRINPGKSDVADNGVDENCDGADAITPPIEIPLIPVTPVKPVAKPAITIALPYFMTATRKSTTFRSLSVKGVPAGATVKVACTGTCPKKKLTIRSRKGGTVALKPYRKKALKVGTTLRIEVSKAGMIGMAKIVKIRASKLPRVSTKTLS
jgi:hypothetical protein